MRAFFCLLPLLAMAAERPLTITEQDSARYRWLHKPVQASRLLDNMETLDHWEVLNRFNGKGTIALTTERHQDGAHSVRLRSTTTGEKVMTETGRIWGTASAFRKFNGEDWTGYNRLSFWVYPELPGFRVVSMLVVLHNEGKKPSPNVYQRDGLDYVMLKNHEWNHVVVEIAHLGRDKVTGVELCYRQQGHETGATDMAQYDFDRLELQRVDADYFAGWGVWPGRIAYSHTGYSTGGTKTAFASDLKASQFRLVRKSDGAAVLTRAVRTEKSEVGEFQVLDFSDVRQPGTYVLIAGDRKTEPFRIADDVWAGTTRKAVNFFLVERCGFDVPGSHRVCHRDWQVEHEGKRMVINGGWHDAGDLSQGIMNTSESVYAMLELAQRLRARDPQSELAAQLTEEAKWGLDWVLKTTFHDGFRVSWAVHDFYSNGVMGDVDDVVAEARNYPHRTFTAASSEAMAYMALKQSDPEIAADSLHTAREDWQFAARGIADDDRNGDRVLVSAKAVLASLDLYEATGERSYADAAAKWATEIVDSQQKEPLPGLSLTGFFYESPAKKALLHYTHPGYHEAPIVAMTRLCRLLPDHADWMKWYTTAALYAEYLKAGASHTGPYNMLAAALYREDEWKSVSPRGNPEDGDRPANAREQIANGIDAGGGFRSRRFPVWHSRRGNNVIILPQAKALASASQLRGDLAGARLAEEQMQWTVGRNPFAQSLMYGEGHDFAPQYTTLSGDMVGSLPVGIQSLENTDMPYYSAMNCYNHKEVWVHPVARWISLMTDIAGPALIEGEATGTVRFVPEHGAAVTAIPKNGHFHVELPAGRYTVSSGGQQRTLTVLAGAQTKFDLRPAHWLDVKLSSRESADEVTVRAAVSGAGTHKFELRASGLDASEPIRSVKLTGAAQIIEWKCRKQPGTAQWFAVLIPDGRTAELLEIHATR